MSQPVMFVSHFRVKDGMLDALAELQAVVTRQLEDTKPRTLAFLTYLSREAGQVAIVHLFADADSMDAHFEGAEERSNAAYQLVEPLGWDVYGSPSRDALDSLRNAATSAGVPLTIQPIFMAGFLRARAA